jgi:hypothetical protein
MVTLRGSHRTGKAPLGHLLRWAAAAGVALSFAACSSREPPTGGGLRSAAISPVTAVPATTPAPTPWDTVPATGTGTRLGPWTLVGQRAFLAALSSQGLASVTRGQAALLVFRGSLSIRRSLRSEGWTHVGDPGSWKGYIVDDYQTDPGARRLFEVTTPDGEVHDYVHRLAPGEASNNSFAAVSPDGQWIVSGEWGRETRLLEFPTPILNPLVPAGATTVSLTGTIRLDHAVRDVQGCVFFDPSRMLCS